jgi:hypothetical protein
LVGWLRVVSRGAVRGSAACLRTQGEEDGRLRRLLALAAARITLTAAIEARLAKEQK